MGVFKHRFASGSCLVDWSLLATVIARNRQVYDNLSRATLKPKRTKSPVLSNPYLSPVENLLPSDFSLNLS